MTVAPRMRGAAGGAVVDMLISVWAEKAGRLYAATSESTAMRTGTPSFMWGFLSWPRLHLTRSMVLNTVSILHNKPAKLDCIEGDDLVRKGAQWSTCPMTRPCRAGHRQGVVLPGRIPCARSSDCHVLPAHLCRQLHKTPHRLCVHPDLELLADRKLDEDRAPGSGDFLGGRDPCGRDKPDDGEYDDESGDEQGRSTPNAGLYSRQSMTSGARLPVLWESVANSWRRRLRAADRHHPPEILPC